MAGVGIEVCTRRVPSQESTHPMCKLSEQMATQQKNSKLQKESRAVVAWLKAFQDRVDVLCTMTPAMY